MTPEERAQVLRDAPPRSWIALSGDESKVVARGATYEETVRLAEQGGENDPVLIMTPESWIPAALRAD